MMTEKARRPGLMGVFNVITSAVLAVVWLWIPLGLLSAGFSSSIFFGLGLLFLLAWVYTMRGAIWFERHRAQAVYGDDIPVPAPRRSTKEGFLGWLHELWLLVSSGDFWRGVVHHHVKLLYGFIIGTAVVIMVAIAMGSLVALINPSAATMTQDWLRDGGAVVDGAISVFTPLLWLGLALVPLALVLLWLSAYPDRALDLALLGPTKASRLEKRASRLAEEVDSLDQARAGAVDAATAERLRIERDLHDGAQPRLVALSMTLGLAKTKLDSDPEKARELIDEAHGESKEIITELRRLARGIHPAVLSDRGLDAALSAVAAHSQVPVDLDVSLTGRPGSEAESLAYFVVSEALTNINKHAGATRARVRVSMTPPPPGRPPGASADAGPSTAGHAQPLLIISVSDDGAGGARIVRDGSSTGLAGLQDRALAARGTFTLTSPVGGPTTLVVEVPCES